MDRGEVARMDPEVLAWALMGMGELLGMRWIVVGGRRRGSGGAARSRWGC